MKFFRLLSMSMLAAGLLGSASLSMAQEPKQLGFELPTQQGKVSLRENAGKVVYVDFWASWCGPCKQSFPFMNELQKKYAANGLQIIAINVDKTRDDAMIFLKKNQADFMIAFDSVGTVPTQYDVKGMPSSYLIGRDGKLIYTHRGFKAQDTAEIEAKIRAALGL
ncbi:TlpA disulfide reductase family protein [Undibacterium cyanobacteriorum]|uniref:TlpA disulfide reductase family protein n=1 Tax=Undibacterium cyanobacteriorum TaxID=3073561 RepID=A0ABY9RHZ4_9BURK|nr:TlpA disulfide reductase family protein [Undibacterium sp. 20NA77.5]WMW80581.1 TlpA disulfide reductase family protein [Undibacterium sp. 20NA77.5]